MINSSDSDFTTELLQSYNVKYIISLTCFSSNNAQVRCCRLKGNEQLLTKKMLASIMALHH